jgi:regulatory protein
MDSPKNNKITDEKLAYTKAGHFCAYQERSQQEVRDRLYEWGLWPEAVEGIISRLIAENFINEERFAKVYAKSKFNQKGWGKLKIKQGLKLKKVPDVLIKKALLGIADDDYLKCLENVLLKKAHTVAERDPFKRKYKLHQYGISRGYESDLVADVMREMVV